jgi:hypothetical protein
MYRIAIVLILTSLLCLFFAAISPLHADVRDFYCYLQASTVDVKVAVWQEDRQGNKGQLIWRGIVRPDKRQRINSRTGNVRFSSSVYVGTDDPLSGDTGRSCEEGITIGVP